MRKAGVVIAVILLGATAGYGVGQLRSGNTNAAPPETLAAAEASGIAVNVSSFAKVEAAPAFRTKAKPRAKKLTPAKIPSPVEPSQPTEPSPRAETYQRVEPPQPPQPVQTQAKPTTTSGGTITSGG